MEGGNLCARERERKRNWFTVLRVTYISALLLPSLACRGRGSIGLTTSAASFRWKIRGRGRSHIKEDQRKAGISVEYCGSDKVTGTGRDRQR